jgi:hypothetical protein
MVPRTFAYSVDAPDGTIVVQPLASTLGFELLARAWRQLPTAANVSGICGEIPLPVSFTTRRIGPRVRSALSGSTQYERMRGLNLA